jgi:hypothetical protein
MTTSTIPILTQTSPALPHGLRQHLTNWTTKSVIVISRRAGNVGLRRFIRLAVSQQRTFHDTVIVLTKNQPQATASIRGIFDDVVTGAEFSFQPELGLLAAVQAHDADDRAVATCYSEETGLLAFFTGDRQRLAVPVEAIPKRPVMGTPDFAAMALTNGGHTVTFGADYEVAFDGLRYAHDPDYQKVVRQRTRDQDQSFGACLRRARFHCRLGQEDLGVGVRTIRRIESGMIEKAGIRAGTQKKIEKALGLTFEKVKTY